MDDIVVELGWTVISEYNNIFTFAWFMNDEWMGIIAVDYK